jgi:o-succinylbenzoate synthase
MEFSKHIFEFIKPAKTSRGEYTEKIHYKISLNHKGKMGQGEIAPLPDLSLDGGEDYDAILNELLPLSNEDLYNYSRDNISTLPALNFAVESAMAQLKPTDSPFVKGQPIKINGLIWMDNIEDMWNAALKKGREGFECLKLKVGALDHDSECRLIEKVRKEFPRLTLRLDANGGFTVGDALVKLKDFGRFDIHSIEQPIMAGQWDAMQEICAKSTINIALDEELIGQSAKMNALLRHIKPHYIILKPTLLGGFSVCNEWIKEGQKVGANWWATSALEGNIGLLAIAEWCSRYELILPQGLGTGALYTHNFDSNLSLNKDLLSFQAKT